MRDTAPGHGSPGRKGRTTLFVMAVVLAITAPVGAQAGVVSGTAVRALDGDTLVARIGARSVTVDLAGIAAPPAGDCFAKTARKRLQALAAGKRISIDTGAPAIRGRVRGVVFPAGKGASASFNVALVRAGLAEVAGVRGLRIAGALRRAEDAATDAGRGIWGGGCDLAPPKAGGPGSTPPPPAPPAAAQAAVTVPAGWVITAGTPATLPVPAGRTKEEFYAEISAIFAEIDRRARGGRQFFFSETLGAPGPLVTTEISMDLCSDRTFRRHFQTSLPPQVEDTTGTWRVTVDLTTPGAPVLERTTGAGVVTEVLDLENRASRVLLGSTSFLTAPSSICS